MERRLYLWSGWIKKGGCPMKFKFMESIAFVVVLCILFAGGKILLTNMERTSHLYDYSDVVKLAKQKDNTLDANTKADEKKEDEKE